MKQLEFYWLIETVDQNNDIIDHDQSQNLNEGFIKSIDESNRLCLVRELSDESGVIDRDWAYLKNDELPDFFEDGFQNETDLKVPQKYKTELNKFIPAAFTIELPGIKEQRAIVNKQQPDIVMYNGSPEYLRDLLDGAKIGHREAAKRLGIGARKMREYLSLTAPVKYPYCVQYCIEQLAND